MVSYHALGYRNQSNAFANEAVIMREGGEATNIFKSVCVFSSRKAI